MQKKVVVLLIAVGALASGIYIKHYFSPKQVIRRRLYRAKDAFETGRFLGAIKPIDRRYQDAYGLDRESLAGHVKTVMDDYEDRTLTIEILAINLLEHEARMAINFYLIARQGSQRGYVLGSAHEPCRAILVWQKGRQGYTIITTTDLDVPGYRHEIRRREGRASNPR